MRVERIFIGEDGTERKIIKVIKDNSVVFIGYVGKVKDFQNEIDMKGGNETNDKNNL